MKFGIREITNVMMKAKSAMRLGNKVYYKDEPVLYFDSLKTSSLEGAATTVYAQGGRGNSRLVAWEGEKTLTFNMEDALLSPESFAVLSGAGLIENVKIKEAGNTTIDFNHNSLTTFYYGKERYGLKYDFKVPKDKPISFHASFITDRSELEKYYSNKIDVIPYLNFIKNATDEEWSEYIDNFIVNGRFQMFTKKELHEVDCSLEDFYYNGLDQDFLEDQNQGTVHIMIDFEDKNILNEIKTQWEQSRQNLDEGMLWPPFVLYIEYNILFLEGTELITGYEHIVEKVNIKKTVNNTDGEAGDYIYSFSLSKPVKAGTNIYLQKVGNFMKGGFISNLDLDTPAGTEFAYTPGKYIADFDGSAIADYYTPIYNKTVKQLTIDPDKFGGNFYLEADTLFRDIYGADHAATFIIPNCKVQSNFTMAMASSGDPSTFNFVLDAFPGYTRFDPSKKVLAVLQINEKSIYEEDLEDRAGTPWAPGAELYN